MRLIVCMTMLAALGAGCAHTSPDGAIGATTSEVTCAPCSEAPVLYQEYGAAQEVRDLSTPITAFSIPIFGACDDLEVIAVIASLARIGYPSSGAMPICDLFDCSEDRGWTLHTGTGERLACHGPGVVGDGSTITCTPYRTDVPDEYALPVTAASWTRIEFTGLVRDDAPPGDYQFDVSQVAIGRWGADGGAFSLGPLTLNPRIIVE